MVAVLSSKLDARGEEPLSRALWAIVVVVAVLGTASLVACGGSGGGGDAAAGEQVWLDAGCGNCHTLAAAESTGNVGPDLDELQPDAETVEEIVRNGRGGMPSFEGELTDEEIADVAAYVEENSG
jgi:mono/diheme cytochrome c family protein